MEDPPRLYGLKALVTSAASGIGEAAARTLAKHGAEVVAADTANSGIAQQFSAVSGVRAHVANVRNPAEMPNLAAAATAALGGIDILVNNFPPPPSGPFDDDDPTLDELIESRAGLVMSLSQAALPELKESPAGRIINIGFLRSVFSIGGEGAFAHARADLAELTEALAIKSGEFGITANFVQPGAIMTPASREVFRKDKALRDYCIETSSAHRLGESFDVAKVVLFLASDDAAFVSGTGINVDGGRKNPVD